MHSEQLEFAHAEGGVTAPKGFLAAGVSAGIKKSGKRDVCVLAAERACPASGVFTTSTTAAPPVLVSREHLADGMLRAVAINAGNANACTGGPGMQAARDMAEATAAALGCASEDIAVCSTGVIGVELPLDLVKAGIAEAVESLDNTLGEDAAEAIMTTDTFLKQLGISVTVGGRTFTVGGMAKGSGMIQPNMATMLAFITTDAPLSSESCGMLLRSAVNRSFNRITVDSDTSTNDTCILMASGAEGGPELQPGSAEHDAVGAAVEEIATALAQMVVRDGEGATKFVTVTVKGAITEADAEKVAFAIANSPLVKTALFGQDANWGRVAMAVGKSGAEIDPVKLEIVFAGITTCREGMAVPFDEVEASAMLAEQEIELIVDLHVGEAEATVWTCDFSYDYVRINGDYRS
ncbi:MAG: bifunctional glutamate N-acetyltransferase/amino-acid acetyltransferase ArgJ [Coriobacteriia bacterium]|nr:bifunctional glutamate N-acetyltransferase/amino-acid acetyltransferase ArgJ [Coriobacteriia bacterium]